MSAQRRGRESGRAASGGSVGRAESQNERSPVPFQVRVPTWVVGQVSGWSMCERQAIDISLPLFLPPFPSSLKTNKQINK